MVHVRGTVRTLRCTKAWGVVARGGCEGAESFGFGVGGVELLFVRVAWDTAEWMVVKVLDLLRPGCRSRSLAGLEGPALGEDGGS